MGSNPPSVNLTKVSEFLDEIRQNRRPKTHHQYKVALRYFQQSCTKEHVAEIDRQDLMKDIGFLRETRRLGQRTIWTKFHIVLQFLKAYGVTGLITKKDRPRYVEPEPEVYTEQQLDKFFAACSAQERLLFEFFLMTGLREAEVQHVTWKDVDLNEQVVRGTAKPEHGFDPKGRNARFRFLGFPDSHNLPFVSKNIKGKKSA